MRAISAQTSQSRMGWLKAALVLLSVGFIGVGCGGGLEQETLEAENPPEIVDANANMEAYMENQGQQ